MTNDMAGIHSQVVNCLKTPEILLTGELAVVCATGRSIVQRRYIARACVCVCP